MLTQRGGSVAGGVLRRQVKSQKRFASVGCNEQRAQRWKDMETPEGLGDLRKESLALYRQCIQSANAARAAYTMNHISEPFMRARIRFYFELHSAVTDPESIWALQQIARGVLHTTVAMQLPDFCYHLEWFGPAPDGFGAMVGAQTASLLKTQKANREERLQISLGDRTYPQLPGVVLDERGERVGYEHPKGPLPPGESEMFARPPPYDEWGKYPLPDPWNPHNKPDGPPDPWLTSRMVTQYKISLARMGPYKRHKIRRYAEHEERTRGMSDKEYLEYWRDNEVHLLANKFELPEYAWAEDRIQRRYREVENENQDIFGPARQRWVEKYKSPYKAVNYAPAMDYWQYSFDEWVPNYNRRVVESTDTIRSEWNDWVSSPARYACWRSDAYAALRTDAARNPLAVTYLAWLGQLQAGNSSTATRPYDHPQFTNKWYTDNGLGAALIPKEDAEQGLGARLGETPVLQAETGALKEEIGCVDLCESRFRGEWWHRGNVKLMSTLATIHEMELSDAMLAAAKIPATASAAEASKAIAAHDWSTFTFSGYSYLRYPDGAPEGVHSYGEQTRDKWGAAFEKIFNYEQCVPQWYRGLSLRHTNNKPFEKGGWTKKGDPVGHWDKMVGY